MVGCEACSTFTTQSACLGQFSWDTSRSTCEAAWKVAHGSCEEHGDCVTTPNYPNNYMNKDRCVMTTSASHISAISSATQRGHDKLHVNGHTYDGDTGPWHVAVGGSITWTADGSNTKKGWMICIDSRLLALCPQRMAMFSGTVEVL